MTHWVSMSFIPLQNMNKKLLLNMLSCLEFHSGVCIRIHYSLCFILIPFHSGMKIQKYFRWHLQKKHRFPTYLLGGKERNVSWLIDWGGSAFATVIWPRCATRTSGLFSDSGMTTTGVSNITSRLKGWQRLVGLLQRDLFTSDQKPYWWTSRIQ